MGTIEQAGLASPEGVAATLLFVDDEPSILSSLRRLFRSEGHRILTAESGAAGLEILSAEPVNVIVSDMRMPQMDGAEFLNRSRALQPDAMRILLTGYAELAATIAAINQGEIFRYVAKPWVDQDIKLTVREALTRQSLERENARLLDLSQRQNLELQTLNAGLEDKVAQRTEQLSGALQELKQAHRKLKQGLMTTVRVLAGLGELRANSIGGHSRRVAEHARALAGRLGVPEAGLQDVTLAALLHDVGKIALSDDVLAKAENELNGAERGELRKHPVKGQMALMELEQFRGAMLLVRHHHELFDGKGYPDGLAGLAIPLGARILAVANDYDRLQSGALFGRRMSPAQALEYLRHARGSRYDPAVVDAFQGIVSVTPAGRPGHFDCRAGQLRPGMVLAEDLVHREGYMLLARGFTLDDAVIDQLRRLESNEGHPLTLKVRADNAAAPLPTDGVSP
jgi:response regulator RpfG family c-di-GMP phosphodiesterase